MPAPTRVVIRQPDGSRWEALNFVPVGSSPPPSYKYVGLRCLHNAEGGYQSDPRGMPEIRPGRRSADLRADPSPVQFSKPMQELSWVMNDHNWPAFSKGNWTVVYKYTIAFTNGNGFGDPNDPRANYVTLQNLKSPLPKLMKGLICGGMFIRGESVFDPSWSTIASSILGYMKRLLKVPKGNIKTFRADVTAAATTANILRCTPGVHAISTAGPIPTKEEAFEKNWNFAATTNYYGKVSHFPQGHGKPVWIPYILREVTAYPLWWFAPWISNELPDPLKIYSPA